MPISDLATVAGNSLVAAAVTDAWEAARHGFARLFGRGEPDPAMERRLTVTRSQLTDAPPAELDQVQAELARRWTLWLTALLEEEPAAEAELRTLVAEVSRALPGSGSRAADQAVIVEGNLTVSADRSGMAIGVVHGNVSPPDLMASGQAASLAINYAQNVALTAAAGPQVAWPWQNEVIPARAGYFQHRSTAEELGAPVTDGRTTVLVGTAGSGKTQLAAAFARAWKVSGQADLLAWVTASSRDRVVAAYAQAGVEVVGVDPSTPQRAADRFLAWLETTNRRWLVVLDDLADPADLRELWPPASLRGQALVTTRRRDSVLQNQDRRQVQVGMFEPDEAVKYLTDNLAGHGRADSAAEIEGLARDLEFLPLALAQAAAYLNDVGLDCRGYRKRLSDRRRLLPDLVPDPSGLPDDHRMALAAAWSLSIEQADRLPPAGLSRPMLELCSMLDPNGFPQSVLISPPALAYLAQHHADQGSLPGGAPDAEDAADTLRTLSRLSLAELDPSAGHRAVRVHGLIQRAAREGVPEFRRGRLALAAADALTAAWSDPALDLNTAQALRSGTSALAGHAEEHLWGPGAHQVLFRAGDSFGAAGLVALAVTNWTELLGGALRHLGPDHRDTLIVRRRLASAQGEAGRFADAAAALEELLADERRLLGPDDPETRATRASLARWTGQAGNPAGARALFEELLADDLRTFGPDSPVTLRTRASFAGWTGESGRPLDARQLFTELLEDDLRVLGPDDPETVNDRVSLARWTGEAGDAARASEQFQAVLPDVERVHGTEHPETFKVAAGAAGWTGAAGSAFEARNQFAALLPSVERALGPEHPETLTARANLARWTGEAGNPVGARELFKALLPIEQTILGRDHPDTLRDQNNLGHWTGRAGQPADARQQFAELLSRAVAALGAEHPAALRAGVSLAYWTAAAGGDPAAARDQIQARFEVMQHVLDAGHPDALAARASLAHWTGAAGDPAGAREQFQQLLDLREQLVGAEHPDALITRASVIGWAAQTGDAAEARAEYAALLPAIERALGPEHPETLTARASLARWTGAAGDPAGARDQFAELRLVLARVQGDEHPDTLAARASLAFWTGAAGDPAGARDQFAELVPDVERTLGAEHPETLRARAGLARWTGAAGDPAGARGQLEVLLPAIRQALGPEHPEVRLAVHTWEQLSAGPDADG